MSPNIEMLGSVPDVRVNTSGRDEKGRLTVGHNVRPTKGVLNKLRNIKEDIVDIFNRAHGKEQLYMMVKNNPKQFYAFTRDFVLPLISKMEDPKSGTTNNYYTVVNFND